MKPSRFAILLCGLLLASCAGRAVNAQAGEPEFLITTKNQEDRVTVLLQDGDAVFDIYSPSGIGRATIELKSGSSPGQLVVWLHLQGLEDFRLTAPGSGVQASVSSSDPSHVDVHEIGSEVPILPVQARWLKVEVVATQGEKTIPLQAGYFEITLPKEFIPERGESFQIEWVDFYR